MTTPSPLDADVVLTLTCQDTASARADLPALRWFEATLGLQDLADNLEQTTDVAHAQAVLVGLQDGLDEAFLQVDGYSGELAAPMEDLMQLARDGTLTRLVPPPRTVLIVDQLVVPDAARGRGHGQQMLQELAAHFGFLTGPGLMLAYPSPYGWPDMDPFTLRVATRRLEAILTQAGFHQVLEGSTWWATYTDATPRPGRGPS